MPSLQSVSSTAITDTFVSVVVYPRMIGNFKSLFSNIFDEFSFSSTETFTCFYDIASVVVFARYFVDDISLKMTWRPEF